VGAFTQEHEVGIRRLPTASSPKLRQVPKPGSRSKFCRSDRTRMTGSQSGAHCIIGHQGRAAFPRRPEGRTSAQCEVVAPCSPLGHLFLTEFWIADVLTEARRGYRRSSRQQCHGNRAPVQKERRSRIFRFRIAIQRRTGTLSPREPLQCATKGAGVQRMKVPLGKLSVQLCSYRASQRSNPRRGSLGRKGSEGLSSESAGRNARES